MNKNYEGSVCSPNEHKAKLAKSRHESACHTHQNTVINNWLSF